MQEYKVSLAAVEPLLTGSWHGPEWRQAWTLQLLNFRPEGSNCRPETSVKLLNNRLGLFGIFRVKDWHVRCRHIELQSDVYKDSCVEFFVRPNEHSGYFNFEFNCGGALLCSYILDHRRTAAGFRDFRKLSADELKRVRIFHSMPRVVEPEVDGPVVWFLEFFIPFSLLEVYAGPVNTASGSIWKANFYKCGDETSHPHWASWTELPQKNFHLPECFGVLIFA